MTNKEPRADIDMTFSSPNAVATPWPEARSLLEQSEIFWLSTVRPGGRPHVTPLISIWLDSALWFTTGPAERKARNLETNLHCVLTTGCNSLDDGLDLVVEGTAERVTDRATLGRVADAFTTKFPEPFHFTVGDGVFNSDGGTALVFRVKPAKVFAFGRRGNEYRQTRWRFSEA